MAASAGAWYRVGTVNVTKNSKTVTGIGSSWQSDVIAIAIGDAFTIDAKTWYEVIAVDSDTSITLDRGFEGTTANSTDYAILRNTSGTILTRIAGQIAVQFNQKQLFLDELRNWLTSDDDTTTLTDSHGIAYAVETLSKIREITGDAATKDVISSISSTAITSRLAMAGYKGLGLTNASNTYSAYGNLSQEGGGFGFFGSSDETNPTQGSISVLNLPSNVSSTSYRMIFDYTTPSKTIAYIEKNLGGNSYGLKEIYHDGNLNLDEISVSLNRALRNTCQVINTDQIIVDVPLNGFETPSSISVTGTFRIVAVIGNATIEAGLIPTLSSNTSSRLLALQFDLSSGVLDRSADYRVIADQSLTITVNY